MLPVITFLRLAEYLKSKGTSLVGTVNKMRREVPLCVKQAREKHLDTKIFRHCDVSLTVYQGKPHKNVVMMSSMHPNVQIGDNSKAKPETVTFYNKTKVGVDIVDKMARKYSVKSASRRWTFHTFCNILDLAGINSCILYREVTSAKISRRDFLLGLGEELTKPLIDQRKQIKTARVEVSDIGDTRRRCQVKMSCCGNGNKKRWKNLI